MKKYNLKKIMRRAWEIKREDEKNLFSFCLHMAWEEEKKVTLEKLEEILEKYCTQKNKDAINGWYYDWSVNLWEKNGSKRSYLEIKEYRNRKRRGGAKCGYWDHINEEYVMYDRCCKVTNILELNK